ncbi:hypothetical protein PRZ48_012608 [Zasmidium cellare]|uniref:Uncharacterized protein n=1 Tax=Zasmidium cellare TaxID=395010 RepID=A0ABR0E5S4_ZASCE|nr:hypothetical protein PRZ48_012608 [Zasmidium cellare]
MNAWSTASKDKHGSYWKLPSYNRAPRLIRDITAELSRRNYQVPQRISREDAIDALQRSDRGLMSYHGLGNDELRGFINARRIQHAGTLKGESKATGTRLIHILQRADDNPRFERFSHLAPELRNRIYEYYLGSLAQPIYAPSQPPLTLTSRLLRQETLPMFYSTSIFVLSFINTSDSNFRLRIPDQLQLFIHNTLPSHLALIERLIIRVGTRALPTQPPRPQNNRRDDFVSEGAACLEIRARVPLEGTGYRVDGRLRRITHAKGQAAVDKVRAVLGGVVARPGKGRMTKDDFYALRRAVEEGLNS